MTKPIDALVEALVEALERLAEYTDELVSDHECRPLENARAALALARAEQAEPILTMNGHQLLEALDFIAPDRDTDQMETECCIQHGPERVDEDDIDPAGLYCWFAEYPEEGSIALLPTPPAPVQAVEPLTESEMNRSWFLACKEIIDRCVAPDMYADARAMLDKALYESMIAAAPPLPKG